LTPPGESIEPRLIPAELEAALRGARAGDHIELPLPAGGTLPVTLAPLSIWSSDARVEIVAAGGERSRLGAPRLSLWRGLDAAGRKVAFLAVTPDAFNGWVIHDGRTHLISSGPRGAGLPTVAFDPSQLPLNPLDPSSVVCAAESLPGYEKKAWNPDAEATQGGVAGPTCRTATVSIETDHELLGLFGGDAEAAAAYCASIIAASSEIFSEQTGVQFQVNFVRLWATPEDPWTSGNTYDQLFQWRDWWFANMNDQPRDVAHFLSGRGLGGGIAWLPGTCTFEYGYGLSANLSGAYPYPLVDYSGSNWDVMVVTHEMGHNFGAPHTHSMDPPIDGCGNGDCSQAFGGTIMSYCHTCPGGLGNVQLAFAPGTVQTILDHLSTSGADCAESADVAAAVADLASTLAGESIVIDVLANDAAASCLEPAFGGAARLSAGGGTVALCVACGLDGRDALTYSPAPGFSGVDTFLYWLGDGLASQGEVTVDVQSLLAPVGPSIPRAGVATTYYALPELASLPDFSLLEPLSTEVVATIDVPFDRPSVRRQRPRGSGRRGVRGLRGGARRRRVHPLHGKRRRLSPPDRRPARREQRRVARDGREVRRHRPGRWAAPRARGVLRALRRRRPDRANEWTDPCQAGRATVALAAPGQRRSQRGRRRRRRGSRHSARRVGQRRSARRSQRRWRGQRRGSRRHARGVGRLTEGN
jgi:hypothetical protein